jgi:endo-1,4-beta-D-glucanase Y
MNPKFLNYFSKKTLVVIGVFLILSIVLGVVFFQNSNKDKQILYSLWTNYKTQYIDTDSGRAIDEQSDGITTSEGQSYSMLRAVVSGDKSTFDKSWQWTKNNLRRTEDNLFSWQWGKRKDNSYGVLFETGGQNVAFDGDIDIAYSLILANKKWKNKEYLDESKEIIKDIWTKGVIVSNSGKLILASNDLEKKYNKTSIVVNPSYFSTYAFHTFAKITPELEWDRLADDCYFFLNKIMDTKLIGDKFTVLPPDWINIDKEKLNIIPSEGKKLHFGYDAVRIPWRVALDYDQYRSESAINYMKKLGFLRQEFQNKGMIYTVYDVTGNVVENSESIWVYSSLLEFFNNVDQYKSQSILESKILPKLKANNYKNMSYCESSWTWFGLALHYNFFNDLVD